MCKCIWLKCNYLAAVVVQEIGRHGIWSIVNKNKWKTGKIAKTVKTIVEQITFEKWTEFK